MTSLQQKVYPIKSSLIKIAYTDKRGRKVRENGGDHLKMMYELKDDEPPTISGIRGENIDSSSDLSENELLDYESNDIDVMNLKLNFIL